MASHKNRFTVVASVAIVLLLTITVFFYVYKKETTPEMYYTPLVGWSENNRSYIGIYEKPNRKYDTITLHGNAAKNEPLLRALRENIRKIFAQKDTVNGLCLHIENDTDYQTFINIVCLMHEEDLHIWSFTDKDIWIFNLSEREKNLDCGTGMYEIFPSSE